ncbi:TadE/TadG family type IV pilus assembly protein [Coprococcus catus]
MGIEDKQRGSTTLETSIVLPIFIFIFLFIFGLFSIVSAQNQMTHALIQSTKSMSLDSYITESVDSAAEAGTKFWGGLSDAVMDIVRIGNDEHFTSSTDWYKTNKGADIAKKRFVGYMSGGDEDAAKEKLKNLGIVNGLDGVNFEVQVEGEELTVTMKYEIQYWFDFFGTGRIPMEQTVKSRLWMKEK